MPNSKNVVSLNVSYFEMFVVLIKSFFNTRWVYRAGFLQPSATCSSRTRISGRIGRTSTRLRSPCLKSPGTSGRRWIREQILWKLFEPRVVVTRSWNCCLFFSNVNFKIFNQSFTINDQFWLSSTYVFY